MISVCRRVAHLLCVWTQTNWSKRLLPASNAKVDHHHAEIVGEVVREEVPPLLKKQSVTSQHCSDVVHFGGEAKATETNASWQGSTNTSRSFGRVRDEQNSSQARILLCNTKTQHKRGAGGLCDLWAWRGGRGEEKRNGPCLSRKPAHTHHSLFVLHLTTRYD